MAVICDVAKCGLLENYRRFRDAYCIHHQIDCSGNGRNKFSETSVSLHQTTRRNTPEGRIAFTEPETLHTKILSKDFLNT